MKLASTGSHVLRALVTGVAVLGVGVVTSLTTAHAESVNSYISNQKIGHATVTKSIWSGFPKYKYRNGVGKPEGVVVHETANATSTIYGEIAYMKAHYSNAFVHSFVDASRIVNIANTNYLAWGAGPAANQRYVQFEQVEVHSKSAFAHEVANAAYYTAYILNEYNLKPNNAMSDGKGTVWSHNAVSNFLGGTTHTDPVGYYASAGKKYFGQAYTMAQFYEQVKRQYNLIHKTYETATYQKGSGSETAKLSSSYTKYRLYNHIKGTRATKKYTWTRSKAYTGKRIYIDEIGTKTKAKSKWYRIRFKKSQSAQKYWVYSKAIDFGTLTFNKNLTLQKTVKSTSNATTYNHIPNTHYLSKAVGNTTSLRGQTVNINCEGFRTIDGVKTTWYRVVPTSGATYWINATEFD
ncbi:peptidoglycan recognition protein family protein [Lactiplantibacillus daowaiensis]|uniref:N-acetylmuramoyl-L-alanine amidase family protein n=1 Tax=Lactiplantibacillus daowaiensis TaxID=2559918 RepID=A0ABW1S213_9LACO|nr:N-acetylmuramoyl-L-alanine amidase [Lactiplantibacillus daowaiensis]